jgi:hypothetical protein
VPDELELHELRVRGSDRHREREQARDRARCGHPTDSSGPLIRIPALPGLAGQPPVPIAARRSGETSDPPDVGRTRCSDVRGVRPGLGWDAPPPPPPPDDDTLRRHNEIDDAIRESEWRHRWRAARNRTVVESTLLLLFVSLLVVGLRAVPLAVALLVAGPATGLVIHATQAGRGGCALWGALAFAVLVVPSAFHMAAVGYVLGCPFALIAFAAYGVRREARAHVGWE